MTTNDNRVEQPASDHAAVLALLPDYISLVIEERDAQAAFPDIAKHLAECGDCYGVFLDLLEMSEVCDDAEPAKVVSEADLSFLRPPADARPPVKPVVPLAQRSSASEILIAFSRAIVEAFTQRRPAGALRGQVIHRSVQTVSGEPAVGVKVEIRAKDTLCDVEVLISRDDRPPFKRQGTAVRLRAGALAQEAASDATGLATFHGIPLDALPLLRLTVVLD
ncbi:MAG TPA: hypothetical protein VFS21_27080 [Roseiflexaceae bacterium]|nr:hypothetical protein [Roseiflexaceae bacterium]